MSAQPAPEFFLKTLYAQLRRRDFPLSPMDYEALRAAMRAGFGWSSTSDLRALCCALWAKSRDERGIVSALFDQLASVPAWDLDEAPAKERSIAQPGSAGGIETEATPPPDLPLEPRPPVVAKSRGTLPAIEIASESLTARHFVFEPQYPITFRQVAQVWRRLRRPARFGAATELDMDATVRRRLRVGTAVPPVFVPPRRNTARLLILCDRKGSMAPYHAFCDEVMAAIIQSGRLESSALLYFHDTPETGGGAELTALYDLEGMRPRIDPILSRIAPLRSGFVYGDPDLTEPVALADVLAGLPPGVRIVILSDGGAARGRYDVERLAATAALLKALSAAGGRCVWINPISRESRWRGSTAAELARYVPMYPMTSLGMNRAVNTLRGHTALLERPL
jgi:uncharacterized protein with von Willebrand factor type A (vWA) domain